MRAKVNIGEQSTPEITGIDDFQEGRVYQSTENTILFVVKDSVGGFIRVDTDGDVMGYNEECELLSDVNDVDSFIARPDLVIEITLKSVNSKG